MNTPKIGYEGLDALLVRERERAMKSIHSPKLPDDWDPLEDTLALRPNCHPDAPMRAFYCGAPSDDFETVLLRCSVCNLLAWQIHTGTQEQA